MVAYECVMAYKANPLVSKIHGKEKRWSAEFAALQQLCLTSDLNEELK